MYVCIKYAGQASGFLSRIVSSGFAESLLFVGPLSSPPLQIPFFGPDFKRKCPKKISFFLPSYAALGPF
jgi:hypothetical protein